MYILLAVYGCREGQVRVCSLHIRSGPPSCPINFVMLHRAWITSFRPQNGRIPETCMGLPVNSWSVRCVRYIIWSTLSRLPRNLGLTIFRAVPPTTAQVENLIPRSHHPPNVHEFRWVPLILVWFCTTLVYGAQSLSKNGSASHQLQILRRMNSTLDGDLQRSAPHADELDSSFTVLPTQGARLLLWKSVYPLPYYPKCCHFFGCA